MKTNVPTSILFLILFAITLDGHAQKTTDQSTDKWPEITLINSIEFVDGTFAQSYPGCAFLLDTGEDTLAVTCKHALWTGKNDQITNIDLNGQVKNWRMHLKNDTTRYLITERLINADKKEKISEWNTDQDYLVFTIKENHTGLKALKLSPNLLKRGDKVDKVGWAFKDREGPQRIYNSEFFRYSGNAMLVKDAKREIQAGTSGSPVINSKGELTGIVSSWKFDNISGAWYPAPCSTDYLWEVLFWYWLEKHAKVKSGNSFKEFIQAYEDLNSVRVEYSDNLIVNLFFKDWLSGWDVKYGKIEDFHKWVEEIEQSLNRTIHLSDERKNELKLNSWVNQYLKGEKSFGDLGELITAGHAYINWQFLCKFSEDLVNAQRYETAIQVMNYTVSKFPQSGQVYFFEGEIHLQMKNREAAKASFEKCLQYYPGYPFATDKLNVINNINQN